jgi:hypothetical protein
MKTSLIVLAYATVSLTAFCQVPQRYFLRLQINGNLNVLEPTSEDFTFNVIENKPFFPQSNGKVYVDRNVPSDTYNSDKQDIRLAMAILFRIKKGATTIEIARETGSLIIAGMMPVASTGLYAYATQFKSLPSRIIASPPCQLTYPNNKPPPRQCGWAIQGGDKWKMTFSDYDLILKTKDDVYIALELPVHIEYNPVPF